MKRILILLIGLVLASLAADLDFGKDLFNDRLYEEAIIEFEKVVADAPTSEAAQEAILYIGQSYMVRKQYGRAENAFYKLVQGFPGNVYNDQVLHYLASAQFEQGKYAKTIETCEQLLSKYPLSEWTRASLVLYLGSFYELGEYNRLILRGERFEQNYENDKNIPDVLLLLAKAYFAHNIPEKGKETLQKIITNYQSFNAAWKAVELEVEREEKLAGIGKAAELLADKLKHDVPRTFEEPLRFKLAGYYQQLNRFDLAYEELSKLIEKFNSSIDLDKYILVYSDCQLKLNKSNELIKDKSEFDKVFRESPLKADYLLNVAKAKLSIYEIASAKALIEDARKATNEAATLFLCDRLFADILLKEGKIAQSVELLKQLLDSPYADYNEILMLLGDIYLERFSQYSTARKFYQRILTGYTAPDLMASAYFKIALCYEQQQRYNEAAEELAQVALDDLDDDDLKLKIQIKKNYLVRFKQKDYEKAINSLMQTLLSYSEDSNKQKMQTELLKVMATDLKEYEQALLFLQNDNSVDGLYLKARLYIDLIEKLKAESNTAGLFERISSLNDLIEKIRKTNRPEWVDELEIKKQLITAQEIDDKAINKLESFIQDYSSSGAANEFRLLLIDHYLEKDQAKAADFAQKLQIDENISEEDYYQTKIFLAEYFYALDENEKALQNYQLAESYIDIFKPQVYFHYAVILKEAGYIETAEEKLAFLVNNAAGIENFRNIVDYYSELLRQKEKYETAIKAQLLVSSEQRTDDFWQKLAEDYLALDDLENAKIALMHIVEKDYDTLFKLGQLHFETNDLQMAEYTFGELVKQNKNDLRNYEYLGQTAFLQEDYLAAAQAFKVIIDKLVNNYQDFAGFKQIALNNIIALYYVKNRPKAETLTKSYKSLFSPEEINDIELSRAIYHSATDNKKAEKIFSTLIKGKNVSEATRIAAYFWRGVVYLERNELDAAIDDFTTVAGSIDPEKSNEAHLKLGTIKFSQEKYAEALEHYYTVIQNDRNGNLAFNAARNFAYVCKTIEEWQKAIAAYEIILERWGDQELEASTIFDIAFCHFRDRKYANASEMFNRAIPLLDDNQLKAEAQYWIGESFFGMEQYEMAVSEFLKVGYNYSQYTQWAASAELKAGEAYQRLNKLDNAARIYERIISKYGRSSQWGQEAEKRLRNL